MAQTTWPLKRLTSASTGTKEWKQPSAWTLAGRTQISAGGPFLSGMTSPSILRLFTGVSKHTCAPHLVEFDQGRPGCGPQGPALHRTHEFCLHHDGPSRAQLPVPWTRTDFCPRSSPFSGGEPPRRSALGCAVKLAIHDLMSLLCLSFRLSLSSLSLSGWL